MHILMVGCDSLTSGYDLLHGLGGDVHLYSLILAQEFADPLVQFQAAWRNFVQTGQIWALLIGIFVGYYVRGILGI